MNGHGSGAVLLYLLLGVFATGAFTLAYIVVRLLATSLLALGVPPVAAAISLVVGLVAALIGAGLWVIRWGSR